MHGRKGAAATSVANPSTLGCGHTQKTGNSWQERGHACRVPRLRRASAARRATTVALGRASVQAPPDESSGVQSAIAGAVPLLRACRTPRGFGRGMNMLHDRQISTLGASLPPHAGQKSTMDCMKVDHALGSHDPVSYPVTGVDESQIRRVHNVSETECCSTSTAGTACLRVRLVNAVPRLDAQRAHRVDHQRLLAPGVAGQGAQEAQEAGQPCGRLRQARPGHERRRCQQLHGLVSNLHNCIGKVGIPPSDHGRLPIYVQAAGSTTTWCDLHSQGSMQRTPEKQPTRGLASRRERGTRGGTKETVRQEHALALGGLAASAGGARLVAEHVRGHPAQRQLRDARKRGSAPRERCSKAVVLRALLQLRIPCEGMLWGLQSRRACGAATLRGCKLLPRSHGCVSARQCTHIRMVAGVHANPVALTLPTCM